MLKKSLFIITFCLPILAQAQVHSQLTHFEDNAYQSTDTEVFNFQDRIFYAFENSEEEIEIWELADQELSLVYKTPFRLCDFESYIWWIYENKIIIGGYRSFRFINFLTGDVIEEVFSTDAYFRANKPDYRPDKSLIRFKTPDGIDQVYDIELEAYVPFFEEGLLYKSATSYYYVEGSGGNRALKKRPFFDTQSDIIADDFAGTLHRIYEDILYFFANGIMYKIDGDLIVEVPLFDNLSDLYLGEDDRFYAVENSSPNRLLHILNSDLTIIESKDIGNFWDYDIIAINSDQVFFKYVNLSGVYGHEYWDLTQDTILESGLSEYESVQVEDSLIFNAFWDYGKPKMEVLNTLTLEIKTINLPPFKLNEIEEGNRIFKKDDQYFMTLYDDANGFGFYAYDFPNNALSPTAAFLQKNYGIGPSIESTGEWIYQSDFNEYSRQIRIYDQEAPDGIYVHEIDSLDGDIAAIDGKFYYFLDHDFGGSPPSDSNYVDLEVFDPVTKTTATLVEAISYSPFADFSYYAVGGRYIVLPYLFDANTAVYDTKNNVKISVTSLQKELLRRVHRITDNYMYCHFGSLYKMAIDDLSNIELIHPENTSKPSVIEGDAITFAANDSLFYYDGQTLKSYYSHETIGYFYEYVSPDKRYIAYNSLQNGVSTIVLYDRIEDITKTITKKGFVSYALDMHFSQDYLFHFDRDSNKVIELFSYHLETGAIDSLKVNTWHLLSLHNEELHIENPEDATIAIYDFDLQLIEEVPSEGLYNVFNNLNYPRSKAQVNPRVVYSYLTFGSSNFNSTLINIYDATDRSVTSYFDCESGLQLHDFVQKDSVLYCLASNDEEGYQLYQIDIENYVTDVKKVQSISKMKALGLFPNPTSAFLYFKKEYQNVNIYNTAGQIVLSHKETTDRIKVDHLPNGMYFIKANIQNDCFSGKFVKEGF